MRSLSFLTCIGGAGSGVVASGLLSHNSSPTKASSTSLYGFLRRLVSSDNEIYVYVSRKKWETCYTSF